MATLLFFGISIGYVAGLLSAIGIAGMDRLVQHNVLATVRPGRGGGR